MTVTLRTTKLDAFIAWLKGMNGRYVLDVIPESQDTADKIKWLKKSARDFFKVTPQMQQQVIRSLKGDVERLVTGAGNIRAQATLEAMGKAVKPFVLLRFTYQGNDIPLRELAESTIKRKLANPLTRANAYRIGVAYGVLYDALDRARWEFRKAA